MKPGTAWGRNSSVLCSHQIGSAIAALGEGWIYSSYGEYYYAFLSGAVMGLLAAAMAIIIRRDSDQAPLRVELVQA